MKKILIILTLGLLSCEPQAPNQSQSKQFGDYKIKTIEGCEYIEYDYGITTQRVYSLTHKGNCSNKIHSKCTEK